MRARCARGADAVRARRNNSRIEKGREVLTMRTGVGNGTPIRREAPAAFAPFGAVRHEEKIGGMTEGGGGHQQDKGE